MTSRAELSRLIATLADGLLHAGSRTWEDAPPPIAEMVACAAGRASRVHPNITPPAPERATNICRTPCPHTVTRDPKAWPGESWVLAQCVACLSHVAVPTPA